MSQKVLGATMTAALAVETVAGVDQVHKLPAPSRFLATLTLWFVLGVVSMFGPRASRVASQLSALVLLTMIVVGGFGRIVTGFLNGIASFFPAPAPAAANPTGGAQ